MGTLGQARSARRETITIALANKAVRLLNLGDPALAALLARQAYAFSDPDEGEFLDPIYDALRQSLNAVGDMPGVRCSQRDIAAAFVTSFTVRTGRGLRRLEKMDKSALYG